jgi:hypothetical protein
MLTARAGLALRRLANRLLPRSGRLRAILRHPGVKSILLHTLLR